MPGTLDGVVAVTTVHPELARMKSVAEGNRLSRLIANLKGLRTETESDEENDVERHDPTNHHHQGEEAIRPTWEEKTTHVRESPVESVEETKLMAHRTSFVLFFTKPPGRVDTRKCKARFGMGFGLLPREGRVLHWYEMVGK